jgi:hypothetical protein
VGNWLQQALLFDCLFLSLFSFVVVGAKAKRGVVSLFSLVVGDGFSFPFTPVRSTCVPSLGTFALNPVRMHSLQNVKFFGLFIDLFSQVYMCLYPKIPGYFPLPITGNLHQIGNSFISSFNLWFRKKKQE